MKTQTVTFFTDKEEEFANLLTEIGTKRSVAAVLVFLANVTEATSRDIERGTDLRQPEVSIAMKYMIAQGWIASTETKGENKGRPHKVYRLAVPIAKIMNQIEREKKEEAQNQLALVKRIREYAG